LGELPVEVNTDRAVCFPCSGIEEAVLGLGILRKGGQRSTESNAMSEAAPLAL
jgi:hypothetical protein